MATALVIESDASVRLDAERLLAQAGWSVATASTEASACEAFATIRPQAALVGSDNDANAAAALADSLRALESRAPIVLLARSPREARLVFSLTRAFDDLVIWPRDAHSLGALMDANLRRRQLDETTAVASSGKLTVDRSRHSAHVGGMRLALRAKELDLLWALASQAGCLCTRERLGEIVWSPDSQPSARTVDVYIRRIRASFSACGLPSPIETVQGLGYRLVPPTEERP